jgi:hypothetical protein
MVSSNILVLESLNPLILFSPPHHWFQSHACRLQQPKKKRVAKANASSIKYHISLKSTHVFITQNPSNGARPKLHNFWNPRRSLPPGPEMHSKLCFVRCRMLTRENNPNFSWYFGSHYLACLPLPFDSFGPNWHDPNTLLHHLHIYTFEGRKVSD